jgi:hypothetical protein
MGVKMLLSKDDLGVDKLLRKSSDECEIYTAEKGGKVYIGAARALPGAFDTPTVSFIKW